MLNVVVCDDEPPALELMTSILQETGGVKIVAACQFVREALDVVNSGGVDLVVFDVEMPEMSGVEAYAEIVVEPRPLVIFATAHPEYAIDAFDVDAIDYILKPFDHDRVRKAVEKTARLRLLISEREQGAPIHASDVAPEDLSGVLKIRDAGKLYFIPYKDIIWVEAAGDYSLLHMEDREVTVRMPVKSLEAELPAPLFIRVHRSAIIARSHIRQIDLLPKGEAQILLTKNASVRASRSYRDVVSQLMDVR